MLIPGIIPSLALYVQGLHPQENCLFPSPGFRVGGQGWGATPPASMHPHGCAHPNTRVNTCTPMCAHHVCASTRTQACTRRPMHTHVCAHTQSHANTRAHTQLLCETSPLSQSCLICRKNCSDSIQRYLEIPVAVVLGIT